MKKVPKVKICGITKQEETEYLNQNGVDYAGFVFYEKSRRNVGISQAMELMRCLDKGIQRAAVTVSPDAELVRKIEQAGFDLLQIHGKLDEAVLRSCKLPIWRAVNISSLKEAMEQLEREHAFEAPQIAGFVVDGAVYGSGKTFQWDRTGDAAEAELLAELLGEMKEKTFILAGGLRAENVSEGIRIFSPDVVDVSSGVEGEHGKEKEKIEKFMREVRRNG